MGSHSVIDDEVCMYILLQVECTKFNCDPLSTSHVHAFLRFYFIVSLLSIVIKEWTVIVLAFCEE